MVQSGIMQLFYPLGLYTQKLLNKKNDLLVLSKGQKKTGQTNTKRDGEKLQNKAMLLQKYE
jgi:hypothetical protein